MKLAINLKNSLEETLQENISLISPISNVKNPCYLADLSSGQYVIKKLSKNNLEREVKGNSFFGDHLGLRVPEIIYSGEGLLVTRYLQNLEECTMEMLGNFIADYQESIVSKGYGPKHTRGLSTSLNREKLLQAFRSHGSRLKSIDNKKILKILEGFEEGNYAIMARVPSHGDIRKRNVFLTPNKEPFLLDFEKFCLEYPTWDMSSAVYAHPEDIPIILGSFLKNKSPFLNTFSEDFIINAILTDSLRLAIHDTFYSINKGTFDERKKHNKKVIDKILE